MALMEAFHCDPGDAAIKSAIKDVRAKIPGKQMAYFSSYLKMSEIP